MVLSLPEYVEHLKDEAQVCAIIERVQHYLEEKGTTEEICRVYLRRILHTYYKFDYKAHQRQLTLPEGSSKVSAWPRGRGTCLSVLHIYQVLASLPFPVNFQKWSREGKWELGRGWVESHIWLLMPKPFRPIIFVCTSSSPHQTITSPRSPAPQSDQDQAENEGEDSALLMERLCKYIYAKDRTDRIRTCAILCHIYHHALHSRWYQARDLMLMSHLQDNIQHADPPVQVG